MSRIQLRQGSPTDFPALATVDGRAPNDWVLVIGRQGNAAEQDVSFRWERTKPPGSERAMLGVGEAIEELETEWKRSEKLVIAEADGRPAGYLMLGVNWNRTAEITLIIVDRAQRGCGIGKRFVREAEAFARERGLRALQWEVQNDNRTAIEFAAAQGFRIAGFHDALYRNDDLERQRERDFRGIALYLTKAVPAADEH
jgi:ribosomal protein S18 acetylase RimI-like enzyme